jgi:hypothetical protein
VCVSVCVCVCRYVSVPAMTTQIRPSFFILTRGGGRKEKEKRRRGERERDDRPL